VIDTKLPINPIEIYDRYLGVKNEEKSAVRDRENFEKYSASSAGLCIRKHWYDYNNYSKALSDIPGVRRMRLGTIMGEDFDDAMKWWANNELEAGVPYDNEILNIEYFIEKAVSHKELNLNGHFDLLIVVTKQDGPNLIKLGYLFDYKTSNTWKFRTIFGKKPDLYPSNNYEFQLGTYGFMIQESKELCDKIVYMANIYINKDNSEIKHKEAPLEYMGHARNYWEIINKYQKKDVPPAFSLGASGRAPYMKWECTGTYCAFRNHCDSPYKNKEIK